MKKWAFFIFCVLLLLCSTSCRTTKTETIIEYVPVELDLSGAIEPVFKLRPDNSKLDIRENVETLSDIVFNSLAYQMGWERWQTYAEALEQVIIDIQETYGPRPVEQ